MKNHLPATEPKRLIERYGLEKIPEKEKTSVWTDYIWITFAFSVNTGNVLVPALAVLAGLSVGWAILSTVLGAAAAFILVSFLSLPGASYSLPAQYLLRTMIGTSLSRRFASPVRSLTSLYWFSVQTIGGTLVIVAIAETLYSITLPALVIGPALASVMAVIALVGFDAVKKVTRLFIPVLLLGQAVMLYLIITFTRETEGNWIPEGGAFSAGLFIFFASLAFVQYVSGVSASSDMTRYAASRRHAFWGMLTGNIAGFISTAVIGTFFAAATGAINPFVEAAGLTGSTPVILLIGIVTVVSMISINLSNAYTGSFSLLNAFPALGRIRAAVLFGIAGVALSAMPSLVTEAERYISLLGAFIVPLSAIITADYLVIKRQRLTEHDLFQLVSGKATANIPAVLTLLVAIPVYFLLPSTWSPGFITFLLSAVLYVTAMSKFRSGK